MHDPSKQPSAIGRRGVTTVALVTTAIALGACATMDPKAPAAASAPAASAPAAASSTSAVPAANAAAPGGAGAANAPAASAAAAAPGQPKPFAEVIKDAKESPGLFPLWQKDEKVWIEIAPEQFGVPFLFTSNLSRGVGEQLVYGGMMLSTQIVEWKRIGNT